MSFLSAAESTSACCDGVYKPSFAALTRSSRTSSLYPKTGTRESTWLSSFFKIDRTKQLCRWASSGSQLILLMNRLLLKI
jgi:hypothetical protein